MISWRQVPQGTNMTFGNFPHWIGVALVGGIPSGTFVIVDGMGANISGSWFTVESVPWDTEWKVHYGAATLTACIAWCNSALEKNARKNKKLA